ncbi:MAG: hypothetical protein K2Y26_02955 [Gemmatimonadaceae bacterium]|nr:hypothetical protein [Gemmatimonadaceae bacterium]
MFLDTFDRADSTPLYWYNHASDLRAAAAAVCHSVEDEATGKAIVERFELGDGFSMAVAVPTVYEMLCGLSFELLLKAILSSRRQAIPPHHRLRDLARAVDSELSELELGVLEVLTDSVRWVGRYPRPKDRKDWDAAGERRLMYLYDDTPLGELTVKTPNGALEWDSLSQIWGKLSSQYWLLQASL